MARPKGSRNKPKLTSVEGGKSPAKAKAAAPAPSTALSDEDNKTNLHIHLTKIEAKVKEKDSIVADIRNERARAQASGFSKADIDFALKIRKSKSETADVADYRRMAYVAFLLGHPIGTEPELARTSAMEDADRLISKAETDGLAAGIEGKDCKSPYQPGSPQDQAWIRKWHDGQKARMEDPDSPTAGGVATSFAKQLGEQTDAVTKNLQAGLPPTHGLEATGAPLQ